MSAAELPAGAQRAAAGAAPELDNAKTKQVGEVDVLSIGTNRIDRFLAILPKRNGSDLHLSVGSPPVVRIDGELERMRYRVLTEGDFFNLVGPITPPRIWEAYQETGDVDFAYQMGEQARYRVNLFRQERGSAAVFRLIPSRVPTAEDLNLPGPIAGLYAVQRGLILVTGPTGSGKSTSLAAILDRMNKRLGEPRRDDRRPHRVRPHQRQVRLHAARDRPGRPELRRGREGGDPRGPGLSARRRDAGSRDHAHGADGGRDRPPRLRHGPHELRGQGRRPHHRRVPRGRAGAGAHRPRRGPARRRRPAAPPQERRRAGAGLRDPPRIERALQRDPRGQDGPDQQHDRDRQVARHDLDGSVAHRARPERTRRAGRGPRPGDRQGVLQEDDRRRSRRKPRPGSSA